MKPRFKHLGNFSEVSLGNYTLDLSPIFENGGEPFSPIMDCIDQLKKGELIKIVAPFEPHPLVKRLQATGYCVEVVKKSLSEFWINVKKPI